MTRLSVATARLRPFVKFPAPDEIAALVASWSARDQARFLIGLGFAIEIHEDNRSDEWRDLIGHQIVVEERGLDARFGTDFIKAIAKVVDVEKTEVAV